MDRPAPGEYGVHAAPFHRTSEVTLEGLYRTVDSLLARHPAAAISPEEIRAALSREFAGNLPDGAKLLRSLEDRCGPIRVMRRPRRRWGRKLGPTAWVVHTRPGRRGRPQPSALHQGLRATLRSLGRTVDPSSAQAWARWTRLVEEERRVLSILRKDRAPGRTRRPER